MGDFHFHKDYTIRESIQKVLCLSDEQVRDLYTIEAVSFKHRADVSEDVTSMRWTEIEHRWYALDLNVGGILHDFHRISMADEERKDEVEEVQSIPVLDRDVLFEPAATPIRLTDRFTEDFTVLRNGTRIAKVRH